MSDEITWLLSLVENDPGAMAFPAVTDALRLAGQLERARAVAAAGLERVPDNVSGRVAMGLVLLELGEIEAAHAQLEPVVELLSPLEEIMSARPASAGAAHAGDSNSAPAPVSDPGIAEAEIESAFDQAESIPDQMLDATEVAQEAMRVEALDAPEEGFSPSSHPSFATATMADLLEKQGDSAQADAIRASINPDAQTAVTQVAGVNAETVTGQSGPVAEEAPASASAGDVATLESWLQNLRRGVA